MYYHSVTTFKKIDFLLHLLEVYMSSKIFDLISKKNARYPVLKVIHDFAKLYISHKFKVAVRRDARGCTEISAATRRSRRHMYRVRRFEIGASEKLSTFSHFGRAISVH